MQPPLWRERRDDCIPVERGVDRYDDKIELACNRSDLFTIFARHYVMRAKRTSLGSFCRTGSKCSHFTAPSIGEFDCHMAETADANNTDTTSGFNIEFEQRA